MMTKPQWEVLYRNLESCLITFQLNYPNYKHRQQAVKDAARRNVDKAIDYARIYVEQNQEARDLLQGNTSDSNGQTFNYDKFFNVEWFEKDMNRFLKLMRDKINSIQNLFINQLREKYQLAVLQTKPTQYITSCSF